MFAREKLPKLGYRKRIHLMNPLIPGLTKTGKMSSSEPNSKIDLFDSDEDIHKKIMGAYSIDGNVKGNCLIMLLRYVIFPLLNKGLFIEREEQYGGNLSVTMDELVDMFAKKQLCSQDLKPAVARELCSIVAPVRAVLSLSLFEEAYGSLDMYKQRNKRTTQQKKQPQQKKKKKIIPPERQIQRNKDAIVRMRENIAALENTNMELLLQLTQV